MLKLKETMSKELKENMKMSHQIENPKRQKLFFKTTKQKLQIWEIQ